MLQLGFAPSHLSFLFLQIIQARRFGFGTSASLPVRGASPPPLGLLSLVALSFIALSGEVDDDMMGEDWRAESAARGRRHSRSINVQFDQGQLCKLPSMSRNFFVRVGADSKAVRSNVC